MAGGWQLASATWRREIELPQEATQRRGPLWRASCRVDTEWIGL